MKNKTSQGFTLIEMIVAMMVMAIITIPMMTMFYFAVVNVERQTASTQEISMARETMQLLIDDLKKFSSLATRIETVGNVTKLVIIDDNDIQYDVSGNGVKKLIYAYDKNAKVLIRIVDNLQSVLLNENQLSDRFYKQDEKIRYQGIESVIFKKDNTKNNISVYIRIKSAQDAIIQENSYIHHINEEDRRVLHIKDRGYIQVNQDEKFNLRNSSFTLETYFKANDINDTRCIFNLLNGSNSKVKLYINSQTLKLDIDDINVSGLNVPLGSNIVNVWKKVVVIYDDSLKKIRLYLTDATDTSLLALRKEVSYDTQDVFLPTSNTVLIDKVFIGNEGAGLGKNFLGALYEPRIWLNKTNIYKDVAGGMADYTKRLTAREDGLAVYIKDDYEKVAKTTDEVTQVVFNIKNAVNNKVMTYKNVEVDEEIQTEKNLDNISELIGY